MKKLLYILAAIISGYFSTAAELSSAWLAELERVDAARRAAGMLPPRSMLTGGYYRSPDGWWSIPAPWLPTAAERPFYFLNQNFYLWNKGSVATGLPLGVDPISVGFPAGQEVNTRPKKVEVKRYQYRNDFTPLRVAPADTPQRERLKQYEVRSPYSPPPLRTAPMRPMGHGRLR